MCGFGSNNITRFARNLRNTIAMLCISDTEGKTSVIHLI